MLFLSLGYAGHLDMYFVYFYVNHFLFVKLNTHTCICMYILCMYLTYMHTYVYGMCNLVYF